MFYRAFFRTRKQAEDAAYRALTSIQSQLTAASKAAMPASQQALVGASQSVTGRVLGVTTASGTSVVDLLVTDAMGRVTSQQWVVASSVAPTAIPSMATANVTLNPPPLVELYSTIPTSIHVRGTTATPRTTFTSSSGYTWTVASTSGFASSGKFYVFNPTNGVSETIIYTGTTSTTFTGCSQYGTSFPSGSFILGDISVSASFTIGSSSKVYTASCSSVLSTYNSGAEGAGGWQNYTLSNMFLIGRASVAESNPTDYAEPTGDETITLSTSSPIQSSYPAWYGNGIQWAASDSLLGATLVDDAGIEYSVVSGASTTTGTGQGYATGGGAAQVGFLRKSGAADHTLPSGMKLTFKTRVHGCRMVGYSKSACVLPTITAGTLLVNPGTGKQYMVVTTTTGVTPTIQAVLAESASDLTNGTSLNWVSTPSGCGSSVVVSNQSQSVPYPYVPMPAASIGSPVSLDSVIRLEADGRWSVTIGD